MINGISYLTGCTAVTLGFCSTLLWIRDSEKPVSLRALFALLLLSQGKLLLLI